MERLRSGNNTTQITTNNQVGVAGKVQENAI